MNAKGCQDNVDSDRTCFECREGYEGDGETCINIQVRDTVQETISAELVFNRVNSLEALSTRRSDTQEVELLLEGVDKFLTANSSLEVIDASFGVLSNTVRQSVEAVREVQPDALISLTSKMSEAALENLDDSEGVIHMVADSLQISTYKLTDPADIAWPIGNAGAQEVFVNKGGSLFSGVSARVPAAVVEHANQGSNRVSFVAYTQKDDLFQDTLDDSATIATKLIVSVEVAGIEHNTPVPEPIVVIFPRDQASVGRAACAYYEPSLKTWSTSGCRLIGQNDTTFTCSCSHMTNFAVLTSSNTDGRSGSNLRWVACQVRKLMRCSDFDQGVLSIGSSVLLGMSSACLAALVVTYSLFPVSFVLLF